MGRIRRFQRTLLTGLTGINSLVFCISSDFGPGRSILYTGLSMLVVLSFIMAYSAFKRNSGKRNLQARRIPNK